MNRHERELGRRGFLRTLLVGTAGTALFGCAAAERVGAGGRGPNIVLVLADDLGYGDLGCYGQRRFATPHLDRMAGEGVRFTNFYAGSPICAPSRGALLTGRHTGHARIRWNKDPWISGDRATFADILRSRGYATGAFGKWALGLAGTPSAPTQSGFDRFFGYLDQVDAHRHFPDHLWENDEKVPLGPEPAFAHHRIMEEALRFVRENRNRPFLLYLPLTLPHPDLLAPEEVVAPFRGRYPETPFVPEEGEEYAAQETPRAVYASMVSLVDRDVGRLLALLRELGIDGDTVVLFSSDNGPGRRGGSDPEFFGSAGPFRGGKATLYEGGIRVPMIARWPSVLPAGGTSDHAWAIYDLLPTFADLAGGEAPADIDGISMAPLLRGREAEEHDWLYWEIPRPGGLRQAVRLGDWKAIRHGDGSVFLYDLASDPGEGTDLAGSRPDVVARCTAAMDGSHTMWAPYPAGLPEGTGAR